MNRPAPSDAATAFRSFPRRLRELLAAAEDPDRPVPDTGALQGQLLAVVHRVAAALDAAFGPGPAVRSLDDAAQVGDRIAHVTSGEWRANPDALTAVQDGALEGGELLRRLQALVGQD